MFGHQHSHTHSHGGQPCQGHGPPQPVMMAQGQCPSAKARQNAPLIQGTNMTRAEFSKIVAPVTIAVILFAAFVVFQFVYGCTMQTATLPNDGLWLFVVWLLFVISFARGKFTSPGLVTKEWQDQATELRSLIASKQKEALQQQREMMKRFKMGDQLAQQNTVDDRKDLESGSSAATGLDGLDLDNAENQRAIDMAVRPERAHWSPELDSNILRMDHWCLWYNNAVGLYNYKFFVLTLVYLLCFSLSTVLSIIYRLIVPYSGTRHYMKHSSTLFVVWRGFCILLIFLLGCAFTLFSGMHLRQHLTQIRKGLTSIEYIRYCRQQVMAAHFGVNWHGLHKFDHGTFENFKKFLGDDWWFWLIPTSPDLSEDGIKFARNAEGFRQEKQVLEEIQAKRREIWENSKFVAHQHFAQAEN